MATDDTVYGRNSCTFVNGKVWRAGTELFALSVILLISSVAAAAVYYFEVWRKHQNAPEENADANADLQQPLITREEENLPDGGKNPSSPYTVMQSGFFASTKSEAVYAPNAETGALTRL